MVVDCMKNTTSKLNVAALYLYLDYKEFNEQTMNNLLANLLKQVLEINHDQGKYGKSFEELRGVYLQRKDKRLGPDRGSIKQLLNVDGRF